MFCKSCGAPLNHGEAFCPNCGTPVAIEQQPMYTQPNYGHGYGAPYAPAAPEAPKASAAVPVRVFGILALCFALSVYFSVLGFIFGPIAMSKANSFLAQGGTLNGFVKTGRALGKAGLIVGIIATVFWTLYFILVFALAAGGY